MDLTYATVLFEGKELLNHTKITKEDAFEIIKQNSLQVIKESSEIEFSDECSLPPNFDVIMGLLEEEDVYASPGYTFNHFEGNNFIGKYQLSTIRNGEINGILRDVKKFLGRGLTVYIHSYYIMKIDRHIDDELTVQESWYWYRIGFRKK